MADVDPKLFREVLGQYPTGVVVVTALSRSGEPIGMTVGSFTSVSLDPPLVAFLPDKSSGSWKALRESGDSFCVNVLAAHQEDVCRLVAVRKQDKFAGIPWSPSKHGHPVIDGAVAYIDCTIDAVHDAGDHHIVVGRVQDLDVRSNAYPLLFFRGGYGSFRPLSLATGDADLLQQLRLVDLARPHMEALAATFTTEVTAIALVQNELVLAAAAGRATSAGSPTRVGQRVPFMPPLGGVYAAWGSDDLRDLWIGNLYPSVPADLVEEYHRVPGRVRARGFAIAFGHERSAEMERVSAQLHGGDPDVSPETLRSLIHDVAQCYNPETYGEDGPVELRSVSAPVFNQHEAVAFTLTLWGPPGEVDRATVDAYIAELLATATAATASIGGHPPHGSSNQG